MSTPNTTTTPADTEAFKKAASFAYLQGFGIVAAAHKYDGTKVASVAKPMLETAMRVTEKRASTVTSIMSMVQDLRAIASKAQ